MAAKESTKRKSSGGKDSFHKKKQKNDSAAAVPKNENGEELSSSALKRHVRKERQSTRRHAESVTEAKVLWNKLRLKTNTKEDTKKLMDKVMELIRGKVREIALQHDASRVVQAAIQFGNAEQRKEILGEICESEGSLGEMAKIQYAHFICLKFIKCCNRDVASIKLIVKVRYSLVSLFVARINRILDPFHVDQRSSFECLLILLTVFANCSLIAVVQGRNAKTRSSWSWSSCCGIDFSESASKTNSIVETRILWPTF